MKKIHLIKIFVIYLFFFSIGNATQQDYYEEGIKLYKEKKYRLLALTNWSAETFYHAKEFYPFLDYFEGIVVSGDEKLKKPDYNFYQVLLDRYNVNASEAVFIDDAFINIEAANDLDFHTIHFLSASQMETELKNVEVL